MPANVPDRRIDSSLPMPKIGRLASLLPGQHNVPRRGCRGSIARRPVYTTRMSKHDFSADEFSARLSRTRRAIADAKLDWLLVFHPMSLHWLTGSEAKSYQGFQCLPVSAEARPPAV